MTCTAMWRSPETVPKRQNHSIPKASSFCARRSLKSLLQDSVSDGSRPEDTAKPSGVLNSSIRSFLHPFRNLQSRNSFSPGDTTAIFVVCAKRFRDRGSFTVRLRQGIFRKERRSPGRPADLSYG